MEEKMLRDINLMQRLTGILNCEYVSETDYRLADYLLKNFSQLKKVALRELMDECFTSKSAVRRFCQQLGYENLTQLKLAKERMTPAETSSNESVCYFWKRAGLEEPADQEDLQKAAQMICRYPYVYIMGPYSIVAFAGDFQRQLLERGKLVYVMSNLDKHLSQINFTLKDAVCLVISPKGEFAHSVAPYLRDRGSCNLLFSIKEQPKEVHWHQVVPLSLPCKPGTQEMDAAMAKYSILFLLDRLLEEFDQENQK